MRDIWKYGVIHRIRNMRTKRKKQLLSLSRYLTNLAPGSSAIHLQAGQAIFCQGDAANAVYYIRRGTVKLRFGSLLIAPIRHTSRRKSSVGQIEPLARGLRRGVFGTLAVGESRETDFRGTGTNGRRVSSEGRFKL